MVAALGVGPLTAAEVSVDGRQFRLPEGFTVERVAGTNLVQRPVSASFDELGRLYVTDSDGSNEAPAEQLKHPGARIMRLEDRDGDGVFDASTVFADQVMFPQGCLWHDGWVYVAAPPSIWRFRDEDGDGRAERREEWFKGGTLTGCANDIHGPYLGPDGFLYWTKGAFAEQTHRLASGKTLKDRAAHIYRMRPDGTGLDVVMSGGMDNPVEVAFTAEGEALFTSTFIDFSQPGYRDGIGHAVYGGVFGKQNDVLDDGQVVRTGPELLHPFYQAGPAAECGLTRYESEVFGPEYRDNLFATTFNLHKVTRHVLRNEGATFASADSDFLVTDDLDFHPTDVLEDADGSLLVVDTGGWYKLCCPSSQLVKPDVLGTIYRIRRTGATPPADPRGLRANWGEGAIAQIASRLGDPRPAVRQRAGHILAVLGTNSLPLLQVQLKAASADVRRNAVWALSQIDDPTARRSFVGIFRTETDPGVLQTALKAIAIFRNPTTVGAVAGMLNETNLPVLRAAFEAFGRTGSGPMAMMAFNPFQSEALRAAADPVLEHSVAYSLIEIAHPESTRMGFNHSQAINQRAALVALDQMPGGALKPAEVARFLTSADLRLRDAATWILRRHPEWGGDLASWFRTQLNRENLPADQLGRVQSLLPMLIRDPAGQQLIAEATASSNYPMTTRRAALAAMATSDLKTGPSAWIPAILAAMSAGELQSAAIRAARPFGANDAMQSALRAIAKSPSADLPLRLEALSALPTDRTLNGNEFEFVRAQLAPELPATNRIAAAEILGHSHLSSEQLGQLLEAVANAGPLELIRLLAAYGSSSEEDLGLRLMKILSASKGAKALHPSQIKPHFARFPATVQRAAEEFLASLDIDGPQKAERLKKLLAEIQALEGDIRRGQAVFNGPKAACSACHRIGYVGGDLGPSLTEIGKVRTEQDLLESIVFPSASFVRSFEPTLVSLKNGDQISGLIKRETSDDIQLATGPGMPQQIARADIAGLHPGTVSVMPGGLDEQLTRQELADLLKFLKDVRWK